MLIFSDINLVLFYPRVTPVFIPLRYTGYFYCG